MLKPIFSITAIILCIASYLYFSEANSHQNMQPPVRTVPVTTASVEGLALPKKLALVSNLEAWHAVTIAPEVSGRIAHLAVKSGQRVEQDQLLVQLDNSQQKALQNEAIAELKEANRQLNERIRLSKSGAVSASELAISESDVAMSEARLASATAELEKRTLRAPFSGVVGLISHATGAQVNAAEQLMTLDQLDTLRLDLAVPQRYIADLGSGQTISGSVDTYPSHEFLGTLEVIDSRVDQMSMNVSVRYAFDNGNGLLKPGMMVRVNLEMPTETSPVVPIQALEYSGSDRYVYLINNEQIAHKQLIIPGDRLGNQIVVQNGVNIGDRIVVQGLVAISDGALVAEQAQVDTPSEVIQ
ncbi:efflux RND transporter periplasmic adaptor subunit [Echinimonas agarilytica]|uniref:Efflux RND transporter periplasmic adaptor subunit n=1 Tax=Echinimonas agarilytica TaxID=1215918 RepID=A0AA41W447_9GAMM|nr:efflux RND transporter periplasmic adaptor subunit [Echinimonas agarilytica]MCM2678495.1 efflux RND transporter periplasmic adaptor subunit [Echinimonas agarilytica]